MTETTMVEDEKRKFILSHMEELEAELSSSLEELYKLAAYYNRRRTDDDTSRRPDIRLVADMVRFHAAQVDTLAMMHRSLEDRLAKLEPVRFGPHKETPDIWKTIDEFRRKELKERLGKADAMVEGEKRKRESAGKVSPPGRFGPHDGGVLALSGKTDARVDPGKGALGEGGATTLESAWPWGDKWTWEIKRTETPTKVSCRAEIGVPGERAPHRGWSD